MLVQPPFPSANQIRGADIQQNATKVPGTGNVGQFSTEPRYTPLPIRFTTRSPLGSVSHQNVNVSNVTLPPVGSLFIQPERVSSVDKVYGFSTTYDNTLIDYSVHPGEASGFYLLTNGLAETPYTSSGAQAAEQSFTVGNGPSTTLYEPDRNSGRDELGGTFFPYNCESYEPVRYPGVIFPHQNLQFSFSYQVDFMQMPQFGTNPRVDVTWILYANPDFNRTRAGNGNPFP